MALPQPLLIFSTRKADAVIAGIGLCQGREFPASFPVKLPAVNDNTANGSSVSANALKVVDYLKNHPQVEAVHHPAATEDALQKELYALIQVFDNIVNIFCSDG